MSRNARQMIGLLLCLGICPAAAQDNPWRVPGNTADGWFGSGNAPQPYGGQAWGGGQAYGSGQGGMTGSSQAWGTLPRHETPAWDAAPARRPGEIGGYAALPPDRLQPGSGAGRSITDTTPYGYDGAARGRPPQQGQRYGGFPDERRLDAPPAYGSQQSQPPPRIMLGEFPPLEGEQRMPSSERLAPSRREPPPVAGEWSSRQPPPSPSHGTIYGDGYGRSSGDRYGQTYDRGYDRAPAYAQPYGSSTYGARDPSLTGPSTLGNPWGGYGGLAPYASPYGGGVPGPYGW